MAFKLNQNAYNSGTSRRGTIPDITAEMMQRVFGDPVWGEGYGLGGGSEDWYFVSDDGQVVSAYDMMGGRGHGLSVGAHSDAIVEPFAAWLRSEVQKSQPNNSSSARHNSSSCLLIRVAGVTFDDRQRTVAQLNPMEAIRLRRDLRACLTNRHAALMRHPQRDSLPISGGSLLWSRYMWLSKPVSTNS
jgi:hypothetical protein